MFRFKKEAKLKEKKLDGFYPTQKLGAGASGEVYLHKSEDKSYAVKLMSPVNWDDSAEFYNDLIWQTMIYNQINTLQTSIKVHGYDIYEGDDGVKYVCFIMDYIENYYDCWDYLSDSEMWSRYVVTPFNKRDNQKHTIYYILNRDDKLKYIKSLITSVEEIHELNIVHGDIKLSNLLIHKSGDVKLIDFGASIFVEKDRKYMETDWTHGTLGYRAPEEDNNNLLGLSSDIYSLGVTIIEIWCGNIWYTGDTFKECRNEVLKALRKVEKEEPEIGKILRKCVDMDGKKRPMIKKLKEFFNIYKGGHI